MTTFRLSIPREDIPAFVRSIPSILAGTSPDVTGAAEALKTRMGLALLSAVSENFVKQAAGETGEFGPWEPLSPVTLALRRVVTSPRAVRRLEQAFAGLSPARRRLVERQMARLAELPKPRIRRYALRILERMRPNISPTRYRSLRRLLEKGPTRKKARDYLLAGGHALILRDTGRALNSLTPHSGSPDQIVSTGPGFIEVGSNVDYLKFHQSDKPRKLKADGTPKLPRRQLLPDEGQMPESWRQSVLDALRSGLASREFWDRLLSGGIR